MKKKNEQYKVLNLRVFLFAVLSFVLLTVSFYFFITNDTEIAIFLLVAAIASALVFFLSPLYFVFSVTKLEVAWILPFKKTIFWSSIINIVEYKLFEAVDNASKYEIMYLISHKGKAVVKQLELPRNKKTRKLIEKYSKKKIL